jgi:hypothetical protein
MKRSMAKIERVLLFCCCVAVCWASPAFAQSRYIIETKTSDDMYRISSQYGVNIVQTVRQQERNIYVVSAPALESDLQQIQSDPSVEDLTLDSEVKIPEGKSSSFPEATSLDPVGPDLLSHGTVSYFGSLVRSGYVQQTGTSLIHLSQEQQRYPTGTGIVAVIDTGVDPNHPALAHVLVPGYDFVHNVGGFASEFSDLDQSTVAILDQSTVAILDQKNYPLVLSQSTVAILDQSTVAILDGHRLPHEFGHGTMVSGLIHLVAPNALIMPLKAFKADGTANLSDIISAIYYAADHGAKVINMSFSAVTSSPTLQQAIIYAAGRGVINIASAGNEGREMTVYPAGYAGVIGVASTNDSDLRSMFSNFGEVSVEMAAPGEALVTTYPGNNYAAVWGTSFSAALVSGASALVADLVPSADAEYVQQAFGQGPHLNQNVGRARLDLLPTMQYCNQQPYSVSSGNSGSGNSGSGNSGSGNSGSGNSGSGKSGSGDSGSGDSGSGDSGSGDSGSGDSGDE